MELFNKNDEDLHPFEALLGQNVLTKVADPSHWKKPNTHNFKESFSHHGPESKTLDALKDKDFVLLYFSAAVSVVYDDFFANISLYSHMTNVFFFFFIIVVSTLSKVLAVIEKVLPCLQRNRELECRSGVREFRSRFGRIPRILQ